MSLFSSSRCKRVANKLDLYQDQEEEEEEGHDEL